MAKIDRGDHPGTWHHVMNRGIARRTVFEDRADVRFFLSRLARCVRDGIIQVHAYSILPTHFHALVRSPEGQLSVAMQRILNAYVRWFNRRRRRDGPLFRGRYRSKPVDSEGHWFNVIRYIDENAVDARVAPHAGQYAHGSARHYARRRGPIWLTRRVVEEAAMGGPDVPFDPRAYERVFGRPLGSTEKQAVERKILDAHLSGEAEHLDRTTPQAVWEWMKRKADLADGTLPGRSWISTARARAAVDAHRHADPDWRVRSGRVLRGAWPLVEAGVLRHVCGLRHGEIALVQGCARSTIQARLCVHDRLVQEDARYGRRVARIVASVLRPAERE